MLICINNPAFSQILLYYPEIFIGLYSSALFRVIGDFESNIIINLCTSRIQNIIVENCENAFLNIREEKTNNTKEMDAQELHKYLFFGYSLLPRKYPGKFKLSKPKFPLFNIERCIKQFGLFFLRLCIYTIVCSIASFLIYMMLTFTNSSSSDKFSVFLTLALVFHITFRLFLLLLIFLTSKQIIYPSLVSTVFEILLTLALLRPISSAESQAINQWYDNHSTRVKVSICNKIPAKNHVEVIQENHPELNHEPDLETDPEKEPISDLENQEIRLEMQSTLEKNDYFEEELDIFNFMIYLLLEMKFFARFV
ncbi:hypothetical protein F8M41_020332 [Gigaspora margarita]|uniref:Uncharacterized protein n=1 Tax=Gigaspora margarita TaxID=4874 RepID=A0A8H4EJT6_GIGMA|nr:hypothetical protein F8M41_020332 [Gigaspora margarita]